MFTGIVEEMGTIEAISKNEKSSHIRIGASKVLEGTKIGDSICVNGICLTVTAMSGSAFEADVMASTYRSSTMTGQRIGSRVNLERALTLGTRLGGHLVSGHVDGVGRVISKVKEENATLVTVEVPDRLMKYMIDKGSIAIDGISLTIAALKETAVVVSIIPQTASDTGLLVKNVGDSVNIETDMIGKYVARMMGHEDKKNDEGTSGISEEFLRTNGFI